MKPAKFLLYTILSTILLIQVANACRCSTTIDMYYSLRTTDTALIVDIIGKSSTIRSK